MSVINVYSLGAIGYLFIPEIRACSCQMPNRSVLHDDYSYSVIVKNAEAKNPPPQLLSFKNPLIFGWQEWLPFVERNQLLVQDWLKKVTLN